MLQEFFFDDTSSLYSQLAEDCAVHLAQAVADAGAASFFVSGGGTPVPLYQQLSQCELAWQKIHVALVDERWVDVDDSASNEALIKRSLLQASASVASFTAMKSSAATAERGLVQAEKRYQSLPCVVALSILGMGSDGHTASLFPHADGLELALDTHSGQYCSAIHAQASSVTGSHTERMSLSLWALLKSRRIILLITGEEKLAVYRQALQGDDVTAMPVRAILQQQQVPVDVYWAP
ncbi:MAG: 6-phosphogluconolactonase [Spongiibacteraceae bacterium]